MFERLQKRFGLGSRQQLVSGLRGVYEGFALQTTKNFPDYREGNLGGRYSFKDFLQLYEQARVVVEPVRPKRIDVETLRLGGLNLSKQPVGFGAEHDFDQLMERCASGMFISAAINVSPDNEFVLDAENLARAHFVAAFLMPPKKVTIRGHSGDYTGYKNGGGTVVVTGTAWDGFCSHMTVGYGEAGAASDNVSSQMTGGKVLVRGNVVSDPFGGNGAGYMMKGGELVIEGTAERFLGENMSGGTIRAKRFRGHKVGRDKTGGEIIVEGECIEDGK